AAPSAAAPSTAIPSAAAPTVAAMPVPPEAELRAEPRRLAPALAWLTGELGLDAEAARQIADYLARARAALGALPTQDTLVMERFFDESGGMQLVIHSPYGSRINRAWGLALRKRFCRSFNFELQAAATDDALILSLSHAHSFALDEVWRYLRASSAEHVLIQALLDAPLFAARWRWNATTSLALPRFAGGRKVAPQLQRMKSEDLLATVFPDQVACAENIVGEREVPKHPLVDQTLDDCLHDAMDTEGWLALLRRIEAGDVALVARDLPAPSPLAAEILNAKPYAFLDDAPLEERRTQAVLARRWSDPESADDLGALDAGAIEAVRDEAWPLVREPDEMHDALVGLACIADDEIASHDGWRACVAQLAAGGRAARLALAGGRGLWIAAERVAC
ncbi:ATP-dependent DNA helicase, partial [Burkholderia pseudomallei]